MAMCAIMRSQNNFLEPDRHALDFLHPILLCRITCRAPVEMLLELGNSTPAHPHNIPGQVHAVMVTRVNQQPPAHHPLEACYDSVVDEPQLSGHCIAFPLENLSCEEGVL
jgi:hypothetical protein